MMRGVFMPVGYRPDAGEVELVSLSEVCELLGIEEEDLDQLPLPSGDVFYLSKSAQRERGEFNRTATFVLKEKFPIGVGLWGPTVFVAAEHVRAE
jgi:hypothetical protein